jgi:DnaJ-class molecular chaperone
VQRGSDVRHDLAVSFMTAALGGTEPVRLRTGTGRTQTISVKIPPGVDSGAQLRIKGKGQPGEPVGDLLLKIKVGRHPYFRRDGLDVFIDVPVTIAEAVFGTTVTVPLLKGSVEIKVPPRACSGQKLRVKNKGLTDAKDRHGDFYAVVQIVTDKDLSARGRELLEELAQELKNPRESAPWSADL